MAVYAAPRSDADRVACLKSTLDMGRKDRQAGNLYVEQASLDAVETLVVQFEPAYLALNARLAQRIKETEDKVSALADLETCVRDFWEVGKRLVFRKKLPAALLAYYGLPQDGGVPKPTSEENWLVLAAQIIKGDADAVAAGYPPMINPSAAEVAAQLTLAQAEVNQVSEADRAYDQAQATVAAPRAQADALIQDVMEQLRFNLRKQDEASQRRIMRSYGVKFTYGSGETPDPDDPTPDLKPVEPAA
jgi:hypothetical protein